MTQRFDGILRGNGFSATCVVTVGSGKLPSFADEDVNPRLPDGEYDLEVNSIHMRAVRTNGEWHGSDY